MKKNFKGIKYEKYYKDILPYLKKHKNQQYFAAILTLSASIFFALFAINPTLSTIVKLRKEVVDSRFVESRLSQKINNLSNLSTEYINIKSDIPFILDAIPDQPEAPTLIGQIQSIAQASNLTISNLEVSKIDLINQNVATKSSSFTFDLTGISAYENLQSFISDLTNMQRVISIEAISISKTEGSSDNLQLNLKGSAYFKKQ